MRVRIEREPPTGRDARRLIAALTAELDATYPPENNFHVDPESLDGAGDTFLVARLGGEAVGCAALRVRAPGVGEIKRMYVVPSARGQGISGALLAAIEAHAARLDLAELVLETGVHSHEAMGLYEARGFARIECFGEYAGSSQSACYAKPLPRTGQSEKRDPAL